MSAEPYQTPEFQNSSEFTIAVTFIVAGGKRPSTADQRARRIFERIANYTARVGDVVEVKAVGGHSHDGTMSWPQRVRFSVANSGADGVGDRNKLDHYVDPERQLAKRALAAVNAAASARRDADQRRRSAIGCHNGHPSVFEGRRACDCVYCAPEEHIVTVCGPQQPDAIAQHRCLCGEAVPARGDHCLAHHAVQLVVVDGDPPALLALAGGQPEICVAAYAE